MSKGGLYARCRARRSIFVWGFITLFVCGVSGTCTRRVEISPADYQTMEGVCYISLLDGRVIETDRYQVTATGFLIEAVLENNERKSVEPYEIKFDEIVSVCRQEINDGTKREVPWWRQAIGFCADTY